jgi:trimethyllysine dioxygenase
LSYLACPQTSNCFRLQTDPCGLQLFHLLEHTNGSGGASLLVDGFYVASILKELHPEAYRVLSTVCVPTHAAGEADILYRPTPNSGYSILRHEAVGGLAGAGGEGSASGEFGELMQVRYNNDDRSVMKGVSAEVMEEW